MNHDGYGGNLRINFTLDYVLAALRAILTSAGRDHKASANGADGCTYFVKKDGALVSVCIVGRFFDREGLLRLLSRDPGHEAPATKEYGADPYGACDVGAGVWDQLASFGVTADDDAKRFLREVQRLQDGGSTWGEAFDATLETQRTIALNVAQEKRDKAGRLLAEAENVETEAVARFS